MANHTIVGVHITDRVKNAGEVQRILTEHGKYIRTRVGLNDADGDEVAATGLILLDVKGPADAVDKLCDRLRVLAGVQVQRMYFSHGDS